MPVDKEKEVARGGNLEGTSHLQSAASETEWLSATAPDTIEEFDRLFQAVEGYRCGALTRDGLMHYYEIARQFRIAHPEIVRAPDETRPQHPQRVITTDTVTGVQQERLVERETNEIVLQMRRMIAAARVRFFREALPLAMTEEDLQLARAIAAAIGEISPEEGMTAFRKHLKEQPCP
jgi:hypothetical protein